MQSYSKIILCFSILLFIGQSLSAQQFKALLITETAGWRHGSIDNGVVAINKLAKRHNFTLIRQQDAMAISDESLKDIDVIIMLSTTGDIFTDEEQKAFERFIQSGKGYVGIHAAADTEYEWDWYTKLVGRMFHIHPSQQTARISILEHNFPGLEQARDFRMWTDEWYEYGQERVNDLHYLISVDENTFDPKAVWKNRDDDGDGNKVDRVGNGMGEFHPISWYHDFDGGRSFYTGLGHIEAIYEDVWFLEHLYGGIYYAATGKGIRL